MKPARKLRPLDPPASAAGPVVAVVDSVDGAACRLHCQGEHFSARVAPHVIGLEAGQRVLCVQPGEATGQPLVIAAYPPDATGATESPLAYDAGTRTLTLNASRLRLSAVDQVELVCGNARLRLNLAGEITLKAEAITASAAGRHRIEGATIDLN